MSKQVQLQIVSFDVPYPADYGGVIDVFYKIKALHSQGAKITLHCFSYGRNSSRILEEFCEKVYYYPRLMGWKNVSIQYPYIVSTRKSKLLLERLKENPNPIIFEGLHTSYYLDHILLKEHKKLLRMHNIEWQYYKHLAKSRAGFLKRIYYKVESNLLKRFEKISTKANAVICLSISDFNYFRNQLKIKPSHFVAPFHPEDRLTCPTGSGEYALYHGNLSVPENLKAVYFILENVLPKSNVPLIVAGKNPPLELSEKIKEIPTASLIPNPGQGEMLELLNEAQVHILPTFQSTGLKLKLLHALFSGRHCLVNSQMVKGTGLEEACYISDNPNQMAIKLTQLMAMPFTQKMKEKRKDFLFPRFSNEGNAKAIISIINKIA